MSFYLICGARLCCVRCVSTLTAFLVCPLEPSVSLGSTWMEARVALPPYPDTILCALAVKESHSVLQILAGMQSRFEIKFQMEAPT